jgi:DNA end-binding protein Ku
MDRAHSGPAICGFRSSTSRSSSTPATSSERRIELHQIHEPTGKRIRYQKVAPGVGPVENEEIIKGYEYEKGKYVLIDPKEIDELKLEAKQTIELVRFVDEDAIDDRYYETPITSCPTASLPTRAI